MQDTQKNNLKHLKRLDVPALQDKGIIEVMARKELYGISANENGSRLYFAGLGSPGMVENFSNLDTVRLQNVRIFEALPGKDDGFMLSERHLKVSLERGSGQTLIGYMDFTAKGPARIRIERMVSYPYNGSLGLD
jgi:hypothetical protein